MSLQIFFEVAQIGNDVKRSGKSSLVKLFCPESLVYMVWL